MRLGTVTVHEKRYETGWDDRLGEVSRCLGTVPVEYEQYECEDCGQVHNLLGRAAEPFYCAKCPALVGIVTAVSMSGHWPWG
jgi:hypothetical protein